VGERERVEREKEVNWVFAVSIVGTLSVANERKTGRERES
jgi:hypothetical protein